MKIALGTKSTRLPFGGGNQFANVLRRILLEDGHEVFNDLSCPKLDIILITEPRRWLQASSFGPLEVSRYLRKVNPGAIVVHRINECDERKGTKTVNNQLALANTIADHTVYVGTWLIDVFRRHNLTKRYSVVRNGADKNIFQFNLKKPPQKGEKLRIVTHHWSPNLNKGWDIYSLIDQSINSNSPYEFHYIGNKPKTVQTKNIIVHEPCAGRELSQKLSDNHIYLTASINEPSGNHHIEGASVGLPLVFRQSGALPEYCTNYGEGFDSIDSAWTAIRKIQNNYSEYAHRMQTYPADAEIMGAEYLEVFRNLVSEKDEVLKERESRNTVMNEVVRTSMYYKFYLMHQLGFQ